MRVSRSFGINGKTFNSVEEAQAALQDAYDNPIAGRWKLGGHDGLNRTEGYLQDGKIFDAMGEEIPSGVVIGVGRWVETPGYKLGKIDLPKQPQMPENPGIREQAFSTYGIPIPVSVGNRAVTGNIIDATPPTPRLIGYREYYIDVKVPIYQEGANPGNLVLRPTPEEFNYGVTWAAENGVTIWAQHFTPQGNIGEVTIMMVTNPFDAMNAVVTFTGTTMSVEHYDNYDDTRDVYFTLTAFDQGGQSYTGTYVVRFAPYIQ